MGILVDLDAVPWQDGGAGLRFKAAVRGGQRARLLDLSHGFVEAEWCTRRHAFHVLEGACSLEARDGVTRLTKGDVGLIAGGEAHRHKLVLGPGERALLLVFDDGEG